MLRLHWQDLCAMTRASRRPRARVQVWRWATPSSNFTKLWEEPGTIRDRFSLNLFSNSPLAKIILIIISRSKHRFVCNRSGEGQSFCKVTAKTSSKCFTKDSVHLKAFLVYRAKMKNGEYESVELMEADLTLMFENAKRYNMPTSSIYKRAFRLQQLMQVMTQKLFSVWFCRNTF